MFTRQDAIKRLCLAVDKQETLSGIHATLFIFRGKARFVKFNSAFILAHKVAIVMARDMGYEVWIDLKFHDTPYTVRDEILALRNMGVKICTIHLDGGPEMIRAAVSAAEDKMRVLGITVLTNIDQKMFNDDLGMSGLIFNRVMFLAGLGQQNGVHGIVCSGLEVHSIKEKFGSNFFVATPGIRFETGGADKGPKRVVTPYVAAYDGSDLIVMASDLIRGGPNAADRAVDDIYKALVDKQRLL